MQVEKGGPPATVDVTPTWSGVVKVILALVEKGTAEGRATALGELRRMAALADVAVDVQGKLNAARAMMGPEGEALTGSDVARMLDAALATFQKVGR